MNDANPNPITDRARDDCPIRAVPKAGLIPNQKPVWLTRWLCVVISVIALGIALSRIDLAELVRVPGRLRWSWFFAATLAFGLACMLAAVRWHLMLRLTANTVHPGATMRTVIIGHFFNTLLFGPAGGDIAKSALYSRWYRHPMSSALAASFLDRLLGFGGLAIFCIIAFGLALASQAFSSLGQTHLTVPSRWIGLSLFVFIVVAGGAMIHRRAFPHSGLTRTLNAFLAGASRLANSPRVALLGLFLGFLVQVACVAVLALSLQSVSHGPLPWTTLLWTLPMISVIGSIPITVSGLGLRENAAYVLLGLYGISGADAVAAALLTLIGQMVWAAVGGMLWWSEERRRRRRAEGKTAQTISVIIPTLNEAGALAETVKRARQTPEVCEIIVVDGGSTDGTPALARELGCRVLSSVPGRGAQMRCGAAEAAGDVILLLHADTWLPANAGQAALDSLRDATVVGGGFWKKFRNPTWLMCGSRPRCALRFFLGNRLMGDQAMFVRRDALETIGGVPAMPLMEEFELCRRMRVIGRLALADATVTTSERRFTRLGVVRTYLRMWRVAVQYRLGTPAHELRQIYERE